MAEYLSRPPSVGSYPEDLGLVVDLLHEKILEDYTAGRKINNEVELMKLARSGFEIGLFEAMRCVREMEWKYRKDLQDMGYFPKRN